MFKSTIHFKLIFAKNVNCWIAIDIPLLQHSGVMVGFFFFFWHVPLARSSSSMLSSSGKDEHP